MGQLVSVTVHTVVAGVVELRIRFLEHAVERPIENVVVANRWRLLTRRLLDRLWLRSNWAELGHVLAGWNRRGLRVPEASRRALPPRRR